MLTDAILFSMNKLGKSLLSAIVFDFIVGLFFVGSNAFIWDYLNWKITSNLWGPLTIGIAPQTIIDGRAVTVGTYVPIPNYPFILFWVALAGNLIIIALSARSKE